jgi:hypothetical protein
MPPLVTRAIVIATPAPTTTNEGQEESSKGDGTEDDAGLSLQSSPELSAREVDKAGERLTGMMDNRFPLVDEGHTSEMMT